MFSVDTKYNSVCENIEECLRQSVDKILDGASRCTCENITESIDAVDILDCFFNSGKRSEGEERQEDEMADAEADGDEPIEGGGGKPKKSSTVQKQSTKRQPKAALDEMKKNERRKYTTHELKHIMDILLQIITSKNDDEFTSAINNIFDTIRESVNTMPKHKDGDGKHGLIYGMTPDDVETKITSYLSVRDEEKDKFGEVFTPMKLINEMFDKLPHAVWADPDKKWLDPANGIGNFPMVAYMRLMEGLSQKIPDDQKRSKHIIENMLYMVEINPKNVKISRRIFGSNANICCADFLNETDKVMREFGVDNFDIIIGNPPFNASQENEGKKGGGDSLWPKFVELSLDLLETNGYLMFVHPSAWRKPPSESSKTIGLFEKMAHENHVEYLEIHDTKDGMATFHVGTRYDWYVIKKHKNTSKTVIKDQQGNTAEINLSEWKFLPNYNFSEIKKILSDTEQDYVIFSASLFETRKEWTSEKEDGKFKFPLIHSTPIGGPRKYWSSTKTPPVKNAVPMFGVSKVIFGESGINDVIVDTSGKYGLTQGAIGLKIKSEKEGKLFAHALESSDFKDILNAMSFGNFRIDWRMFKYFRPDFYKKFLGTQAASTKIQAVVRGHQQRQKTRKIKETKKNSGSPKTKKSGGSRRSRRVTNKTQQTTRKNKFFNWL